MKQGRIRIVFGVIGIALVLLPAFSGTSLFAQSKRTPLARTYLGFDRNEYPGDENLEALRRSFAFTGYWLTPPPEATSNSWLGKRNNLKKAGFGFLLLFNGRPDAELKKGDAAGLGRSDAAAAVAAAKREGFPLRSVIFLDQEEGGSMLPEQRDYIYAWIDGVQEGGFRAGVYCSGIAAAAGNAQVVTADNIRENAGGRKIEFWVSNDECPPSPGCAYPENAPVPSTSGTSFAAVWQFAQSPRRRDFAGGCSNYAHDGNCYPPGLAQKKLFVDLDSASFPDPSQGR